MTSQIITLHSAQMTPDELERLVGSSDPVAFLVLEDDQVASYCPVLQRVGAPCAGIAFVSRKARRFRRRCVAGLGLEQCYNCPCQVFADEDAARQWLQEQLASSTQ